MSSFPRPVADSHKVSVYGESVIPCALVEQGFRPRGDHREPLLSLEMLPKIGCVHPSHYSLYNLLHHFI